MKSTAVKSALGNSLCGRSIRDRAKLKIIKLLTMKQLIKEILSILKSKKRLRNWNQNKNQEYTIQNDSYLQLPPSQKLMKDFDF